MAAGKIVQIIGAVVDVEFPQDAVPQVYSALYEPDPKALLDTLLRRYVESQVYQGVVENLASEQAARMVAMKAATDNGGNLIKELQLVYNKARQAIDKPALSDLIGPVKVMLQAYDEGRIDKLYIVSNKFNNTMSQTPTITQLLPLPPAEGEEEMKAKTWDSVGYLVVSTDRGLCGGLNINLFKKLLAEMKGWADKGVQSDLAIVGSKGVSFFGSVGGNVVAQVTGMAKIGSVKNTQKITKAMEMVAASKMRKTQERMAASRPYADTMRKVIGHLALGNLEYKHPYLDERDVKRPIANTLS
ncbi:hypothetical protein CRX72_00405 [Pantoea sp. BRM17]|nr:hypothetical protein CRX72_00405 [Pantoea sp. BRM17]